MAYHDEFVPSISPGSLQIRTLGMLRSRFESVPFAFSERLVPGSKVESSRNQVVFLMLKILL